MWLLLEFAKSLEQDNYQAVQYDLEGLAAQGWEFLQNFIRANSSRIKHLITKASSQLGHVHLKQVQCSAYAWGG